MPHLVGPQSSVVMQSCVHQKGNAAIEWIPFRESAEREHKNLHARIKEFDFNGPVFDSDALTDQLIEQLGKLGRSLCGTMPRHAFHA